ncbi:hypothetical protein PENARI_c003G11372 [Penicillium arizonense]|uniref:DNA replication complex GINS protein SLD5 n=1 Tax=Penicillium arizonense TaxID=1835702 RepID=A0A1F5LUY8_PENAI|nr:hypothetical protein PENARI_c003G11372 [Penicillium arizonense]OGE56711.1 hypothetical protein PENARI_c003G11372 [Penicillium arizonense]
MDIDDILASVDRGPGASRESAALDHQLLTRFWVAERAVSEVLPWPAPLMERMMDRVRMQIETIEDLAASSGDTDLQKTTNTHNPNLNLRLSILQTDLARTQYIIRSLLRARLAKITKYSMHYLVHLASRNKNPLSQTQSTNISSQNPNQQPEDSVPDISSSDDLTPLSEPEAAFLHSHQTLLAGHYAGSFMGAFPRQLRRLDDNAGGTSMIQGPELREVVFVRCLGVEVPVVVGGEEDGGDFGVTMRMGDVWVVRWEGVKAAWGKGEVELL